MAVRVGSARIDERGAASGGKAGDQTGGEVSTQAWYKHTKGWVVIRAKNATVRGKIAEAMEAACANNNIGYDQSQRNTLYNAVKSKGFNPAKATSTVETDCSALVRVCVNYAGISVGDFNTASERSALEKTGAFDVITDATTCGSSANLKRGDILVTKTKGHTVVVLDNGSNAGTSNPAPASTGTKTKYNVKITASALNVRGGAGTNYKINTVVGKGEVYTIVEEKTNGSTVWGKLVSGAGWISLKYTKRV